MSNNPPNTLPEQLTTSLLQRYALLVSPTWLAQFLSTTRQPHPPIPALTSTAHFRILASDITTSLSSGASNSNIIATANATIFPHGTSDTATKELRLAHAIPCQVLDIQDIGASKWSQVEAIERVERGEEVRGREVIRNVPGITDDGDENTTNSGPHSTSRTNANANANTITHTARIAGENGTAATTATKKRSQGPHKLILQDAAGTKVVAFEQQSIPRLWIGDDGMAIGCKMVLLPGTIVRRGMVMLVPGTVRVLGGKIESWDNKWREDRKMRLIEDVTGDRNG